MRPAAGAQALAQRTTTSRSRSRALLGIPPVKSRSPTYGPDKYEKAHPPVGRTGALSSMRGPI
jgi:hypothetical protein